MEQAKTLTVDDLDNFVKQIKDKRDEAEQVGVQLTTINKEIASLEAKAVGILKELNRDNYRSPYGMITMERKWRVSLPPNDIAKMEFFGHLRERGIFEQYATVNYNSLNSLYLTDWKEAQKEGRGMEFAMPGIEAPKLHEALKFLKGKT